MVNKTTVWVLGSVFRREGLLYVRLVPLLFHSLCPQEVVVASETLTRGNSKVFINQPAWASDTHKKGTWISDKVGNGIMSISYEIRWTTFILNLVVTLFIWHKVRFHKSCCRSTVSWLTNLPVDQKTMVIFMPLTSHWRRPSTYRAPPLPMMVLKSSSELQ